MANEDRERVKFEAGLFPSEEYEESDAPVKLFLSPFIRNHGLANLLFRRAWERDPRRFIKRALIVYAVLFAIAIAVVYIIES